MPAAEGNGVRKYPTCRESGDMIPLLLTMK
jgi:hypothetical protein